MFYVFIIFLSQFGGCGFFLYSVLLNDFGVCMYIYTYNTYKWLLLISIHKSL